MRSWNFATVTDKIVAFPVPFPYQAVFNCVPKLLHELIKTNQPTNQSMWLRLHPSLVTVQLERKRIKSTSSPLTWVNEKKKDCFVDVSTLN